MNDKIAKHYKEQYRYFQKLAFRRLHDHHHAEDAVQEAYINALKYSSTYVEGTSLDKWMGGILQNTLKKYFRELQAQGMTMEVDPEKFPVELFPTDPQEMIDLEYEIGISPLTPECKEALVLWSVKGWTPEDVEILCGVGKNKIYQSWRALKRNLEK